MPKISHFILLSQKILKISIKHFFKVFVPATGGNLVFDFLKVPNHSTLPDLGGGGGSSAMNSMPWVEGKDVKRCERG